MPPRSTPASAGNVKTSVGVTSTIPKRRSSPATDWARSGRIVALEMPAAAAASSCTSVSVSSSCALSGSFATRSTPGPKTRSRSCRAWSRASWPTSTEAITSTAGGRPPSRDAPRPRAADDRDEHEDGDGRALLHLAAGTQRRHPARSGRPPRKSVLQPVDQAAEGSARGRSGAPGPCLRGGHAPAHGVGKRDRRPIRRAREGLGGPNRHERPAGPGDGDLGCLQHETPVAASPAGLDELTVEVLERGLRVERDESVLEFLRPQAGDDVGRDEHELVADGELAAPDVRFQLRCRKAALAVRVRQRGEPGAPAEVRLRWADGCHVQLVVSDDRDRHADRGVPLGAAPGRSARERGRGACSPRGSP